MKKLALLFACGLVLVSCNSSTNRSTDMPKDTATAKEVSLTSGDAAEDWVSLFDGKTTNGWHSYNKPTIGGAWSVQDGALFLDAAKKSGFQTNGGGDILTEKEYENFHLKLEWKIAPNGNSGIMFLVKEEPKYLHAWFTGPEFQVLDNNGHPDAKVVKHRAGDLYDLIVSSPETVKPAGEWNAVELKIDKGSLEYWQNGTKVVNTTLWNEDWNKLVAGSKFKPMPDFGKYKKGRIALQDHGNNVWYRNIMIREL